MNPEIMDIEQTTYGAAVARWDHHQMLKHFVVNTPGQKTLAQQPSISSSSPAALAARQCGKLLHMALIGSAFGCIHTLMARAPGFPDVRSFIDDKNMAGRTPLAWTVSTFDTQTCSIEAANILLDHGARKTVLDSDDVLPFGHLVRVLELRLRSIIWEHQEGDYAALALRLLLTKAAVAQLSEQARALYQQSLDVFLAMAPKVSSADQFPELEPLLRSYATWPPPSPTAASKDSAGELVPMTQLPRHVQEERPRPNH